MSYSSEVLADSPLLWWRMELGGTDASGNSRPSATGTTGTVVTGILAGDPTSDAMQFNGSTQHLRENYDTWMAVSSFTVECWVKTAATTQQYLIARDSSTTDRIWALGHSPSGAAGKPYVVRLKNSSGTLTVDVAQGTTSINDGNPHHIVSTYDGTSLKIYVDGSLQATTAASGGLYAAPVWLDVASLADGSSLFYNGVLDEVAFYGTALSATRIAAHYTAGASISAAAAGTASLSLSASGTGTATGAGTAALTLSASGAAQTGAAGTASLSLFATGDTEPPAAAAGTASLSLSASGAIGAGTAGTAVLTLTADGTGAGAQAAAGTATLSLSAFGSATLGAAGTALLELLAVGEAAALYVTDTSNFRNGRARSGYATVTLERPVAAPPATVTFGTKVDKALAYPVPTMVEGRPT